MARQKVKVEVFEIEVFGSSIRKGKYEPDKLGDVLEHLQKLLEKIPSEYRDTAIYEVESVGGYDGEHHAEVYVYYYRPETDKEMSSRQRNESRQREAHETEERRLFTALKKKYGE